MKHRLERLGEKLRRDGLERRAFVVIAYAYIWFEPRYEYRDILEAYADYVDDAPERVHADLCYHFLATGREIGPEQYFDALKVEVESEDRVLTQ